MAGLASVLASVNQLAKQLNDSLNHIWLNRELILIDLRFGTDSVATIGQVLKSPNNQAKDFIHKQASLIK